MDRNDIVMVSAGRTPFGRYGGSLKDLDYFDLGAIPMREVLERVNLEPKVVDEVFWVPVRFRLEGEFRQLAVKRRPAPDLFIIVLVFAVGD